MSLILNNKIKTSPSSVYLGEDMLWGSDNVTPPTPPTPTYPADNEVRFTFADGTTRTIAYDAYKDDYYLAIIIDQEYDAANDNIWMSYYPEMPNPYGPWVNDAIKIEVGDGISSCHWTADEDGNITFESLSSVTFGANVGEPEIEGVDGPSSFNDCLSNWENVNIRELTFRGDYRVAFDTPGIYCWSPIYDRLKETVTSVTFDSPTVAIGQCEDFGALTQVTIGSGVRLVQLRAFVRCTSLNTIFAYPLEAPSLQGVAFYNLPSNGTLYVPSGSDYSDWTSYTYGIPNTWTVSDIL